MPSCQSYTLSGSGVKEKKFKIKRKQESEQQAVGSNKKIGENFKQREIQTQGVNVNIDGLT